MLSEQPGLPPKWQLIAWQKRDEQRSRIPSEWLLDPASHPSSDSTSFLHIPRACGLLNSEELRLTEAYDATGLADAIRKRQVKSVDVVRAFCKVCSIFKRAMTIEDVYLELTQSIASCHSTPIDQLPYRDLLF